MKTTGPHGGYMQKILRVDLTEGKASAETVDPLILRQYVGGTGLGARLLFDENEPGTDPFDPRNRIIITTGPLTGTLVPGSGTYSVVARNTLTGLTTAAQSNGFFGARLKYAGYDAVIIQGESRRLVYLCIDDDKVTIEDAAMLAGKGTFATDLLLRKKHGEDGFDNRISVAAIGPAGENTVRFACLVSDRGHIAATGGIGALFGAKRLKAIVVRGSRAVPLNRENIKAFSENCGQWRLEARDTALGKTINSHGSIGFFANYHAKGWVPVKNLLTNEFPGHEKFEADNVRQKLHTGVVRVCSNCTFRHCRTVQVNEGPYKGVVGEEVEYEILAGFGPNWGINDPGATTMLNKLNDDLGMDAKEASFLISMMMEGYEKGWVTKDQLGGIELKWGDPEAAARALRCISRREGLGDLLAEGVMRSSEKLGGGFPEIAVYVKRGNAPHLHDSRSRWGTLLNQIMSDMGSIEGLDLSVRGSADLGVENPTTEPDEVMGRVAARTAWWRQFQESLTYCYYQTASGETMIRTLNSLTGTDYNMEDALKIGRRVVTLLRMLNLREGMTAEHDCFSPRLQMPPVNGPAQGKSLAPTFERVRDAYYSSTGWGNDGIPTKETLLDLDLQFALPVCREAGGPCRKNSK